MEHLICQVTGFAQLGTHILRVEFDDATSQVIDFSPVLFGELFGPLRDPAIFSQVRIDAEVKTLVWPNGADFDPATLHDWPDHVGELSLMAKTWRERAG